MIQISNVSYSFNNGVTILFTDFRVARGEQCLLLGESGSGKTTLLHLIGGLLRGYKGSILLDDVELSSLSESALDRFRGQKVGFIFQRNHLIQALTVEKNLMMAPYLSGLHFDKTGMQSTLENLGLKGREGSKVTELSQGQAQRVAIARAVMNHPSLILADEPTSSLDDKNCDRVIHLLMNIAAKNNATLLVATHDQRLKSIIGRTVRLTSHHS
jgi:putative ABC transport system ATP-binding protein